MNQHTVLGRLAVSAIALLHFSSCAENHPPIQASPSGNFGVYGMVHGPSGAIVTLHLVDSDGKETSRMFTGASDAMKWAVGWMPTEDVVVLYSSDIGTTAYDIENGQLVKTQGIDPEIKNHAERLYESKYGVAAPSQ